MSYSERPAHLPGGAGDADRWGRSEGGANAPMVRTRIKLSFFERFSRLLSNVSNMGEAKIQVMIKENAVLREENRILLKKVDLQ